MLRTSMLSWSDKKRVRVALGGILAAAAVAASGGLSVAAAPLPASLVATPAVQAHVSPDGVSWSWTHITWPVRYHPDGVSWS
jgi:hypothetical protein